MTKSKDQPRVFFRNHDLYETEGVDGKPKSPTPGKGFYSQLGKYKSVDEFLKDKRKKQRRKQALLFAITYPDLVVGKKYSSQDPYEDQNLTPVAPISPAETDMIGMLDGIYPKEDLDYKGPENLYYGILETHEYAADDHRVSEDTNKSNDHIDYYKLGLRLGAADVKEMGMASDILSGATALMEPYTLDPSDEDYGKKLMDYARGYIQGSQMPAKGKSYGSAEGEMQVIHRHLQQIKQLKELGKLPHPGQYLHP